VTTTGANRDWSSQSNLAKVVLKACRQMLLFLSRDTSAVIAILVLVMFVPYSVQAAASQSISVFLIVVMAGTIGALFSSLECLYDLKELPHIRYHKQLGSEYGSLFVYLLVRGLVGGTAAAVLYFIFAGGMLSGAFFPAFTCKQSNCTGFATLLVDYDPAQALDYAKTILWGFLAGFAERLVPNLLNHFAQDADKDDSASARDASGLHRSESDHPCAAAARLTRAEENAVGTGGGLAPTIASRGFANQG
jgi:hypothetical protein